MAEYLKKILTGREFEPPASCATAFNSTFQKAVNPEWHQKKGQYEAVFYMENREQIALFDATGRLLEHKILLTVELLPEPVRSGLESRGEIMHALIIRKGDRVEYEMIVRERPLERFLFIVSEDGEILREQRL